MTGATAPSLRLGAPASPDDQAAGLRALVGAAAERRAGAGAPPARRGRVVAVASGKGGVGKTTLAVNLAACLARRGTPTVLVDADLGLANADVLCGLFPRRRMDEALGSGPRAALRDLAVPAPGGFLLVPGVSGAAPDAEQCRALRAGIDTLRREASVVLVDLGAGISGETLSVARGADAVLVVTTPDPAAVTDAYALIKCLHAAGGPALRLVVNQARGAREARATHGRIAGVCARFLRMPLPLLGWVPADRRLAASVRERRVLLAGRSRGRAGRRIARLSGAVSRIRENQSATKPDDPATCGPILSGSDAPHAPLARAGARRFA